MEDTKIDIPHGEKTRAYEQFVLKHKHLSSDELTILLGQEFGIGTHRSAQILRAVKRRLGGPKQRANKKPVEETVELPPAIEQGEVLRKALAKIQNPCGDALTPDEVYALAADGVAIGDIAGSQGLTENEFKAVYEKDFNRGAAAYRIKLQATSAKVGLVDENPNVIGKLREFEFGEGRRVIQNNFFAGSGSIRDKLDELFGITHQPQAEAPSDGE